MAKRKYRVFVSHAGADLWLAEQVARSVEDCGADTFLDRRDIAASDNFRKRIRQDPEVRRATRPLYAMVSTPNLGAPRNRHG
jgi:hypothetical protein